MPTRPGSAVLCRECFAMEGFMQAAIAAQDSPWRAVALLAELLDQLARSSPPGPLRQAALAKRQTWFLHVHAGRETVAAGVARAAQVKAAADFPGAGHPVLQLIAAATAAVQTEAARGAAAAVALAAVPALIAPRLNACYALVNSAAASARAAAVAATAYGGGSQAANAATAAAHAARNQSLAALPAAFATRGILAPFALAAVQAAVATWRAAHDAAFAATQGPAPTQADRDELRAAHRAYNAARAVLRAAERAAVWPVAEAVGLLALADLPALVMRACADAPWQRVAPLDEETLRLAYVPFGHADFDAVVGALVLAGCAPHIISVRVPARAWTAASARAAATAVGSGVVVPLLPINAGTAAEMAAGAAIAAALARVCEDPAFEMSLVTRPAVLGWLAQISGCKKAAAAVYLYAAAHITYRSDIGAGRWGMLCHSGARSWFAWLVCGHVFCLVTCLTPAFRRTFCIGHGLGAAGEDHTTMELWNVKKNYSSTYHSPRGSRPCVLALLPGAAAIAGAVLAPLGHAKAAAIIAAYGQLLAGAAPAPGGAAAAAGGAAAVAHVNASIVITRSRADVNEYLFHVHGNPYM